MVVVVTRRRNNTLQMATGLLHHNKDIRKCASLFSRSDH